MEPSVAPRAEEQYPTPAVLGASIATFFFPIYLARSRPSS